jgi:hypothetical protein
MPTPYTNERLAAYNVNTNGTIDTSTYTLEDDISITGISMVILQLSPPSGYQIMAVTPSSGWSSYVYVSTPITYAVAVPDAGRETEVEFTFSIIEELSGQSIPIDPKFTVKNTMSA